jgi:large subunit ribosomal protein L29
MKAMKASELRELTADDLRAKAGELEEQLFRMRVKKAMGALETPIAIRTVRRDLARVKTVLGEKAS